MSLQNKNNQFLGNSSDVAQDDIVDIFDQYGVGDDTGSDAQVTVNTAEDTRMGQTSDVRPQEDTSEKMREESVQVEVPEKESATAPGPEIVKSWEMEYEGGHEKAVSMASDPIDLPEKTPVVQDQEKNEMSESVEETPKSDRQKSPELPVQQAVITPIEQAPPAVVVTPQPVAPPMKENVNSVVQSAAQDVRRSFTQSVQIPKTQKTNRTVTIDPSKKTIAIVDDDVDTLDMYAKIFDMADYNVIKASDGLEALSVISEHIPHLIFTGIVMPRMDGFAMMEALRQNSRLADIPVVINSHLGREADRKRAEELGAKDFIIRGFTPPREVLERIGALLLRSEYTFRFDATDPEARKLVKDLGASNFFVCPRGQEMVLKLSIEDPKELRFSARFSCVDTKEKN